MHSGRFRLRHDFGVNEGVYRKFLTGASNGWKPFGEASSAPGPEHNRATTIRGEATLTVELRFVTPGTPIWQLAHRQNLHRLNEGRPDVLVSSDLSRGHLD
jgi:hypothetical protein